MLAHLKLNQSHTEHMFHFHQFLLCPFPSPIAAITAPNAARTVTAVRSNMALANSKLSVPLQFFVFSTDARHLHQPGF